MSSERTFRNFGEFGHLPGPDSVDAVLNEIRVDSVVEGFLVPFER